MYNIGELVLLKAPLSAVKFINRWNGPFDIIKNFSDITYEFENITNKKLKLKVHSNLLKLYTPRENLSNTQEITSKNQHIERKSMRTHPTT